MPLVDTDAPEAERLTITSPNGSTLAAFRHRANADAPIVICESGLGGDHYAWDSVLALIRPWATVITYDRAGYGESPPQRSRRLSDLAIDLSAVVTTASEGRPVFLAGHSMGGRISRAAASRLPAQQVAGVLLIEGATDDVVRDFPRIDQSQRRFLRLAGLLCPLGLTHLPAVRRQVARMLGAAPQAASTTRALVAMARRSTWITAYQEWMTMHESMPQQRSDLRAVGLIASAWTSSSSRQDRRLGVSNADLLNYIEADFHRHFPDGTLHRVDGTGHNIQGDRPDVVAAALRELIGLPATDAVHADD